MARSGHRVAVVAGDGVGPEVVAAARVVLDAASERFGVGIEYDDVPGGGAYYTKHGLEWPQDAFQRCSDADAVFLGAIGWPGADLPDGNIAGAGIIFGLRFGLDLYANVRPCRLYEGVPHKIHDRSVQVWDPAKVDLTILRENTEGLYSPIKGSLRRGGSTELAIDTNVITRKGAERVIRRAFETALVNRPAPGDGKRRVTCIDKANVLAGSRLFRAVYDEVAAEHPGIEKDYAYVDAFTQWLVRTPENYQVCVASNMLGDIVTDLAAVLQGGMGMAPSGNVGDGHAMFEPVHGSAPKHAGKDVSNPIACILAAEMMLRWLAGRRGGADGQRAALAAAAIEDAVAGMLRDGKVRTYDIGGSSKCSEVGAEVARRVADAR